MLTYVHRSDLIRIIQAGRIRCERKIVLDPATSLGICSHLMNELKRFSNVVFEGAAHLQLQVLYIPHFGNTGARKLMSSLRWQGHMFGQTSIHHWPQRRCAVRVASFTSQKNK